MPADNALQTRQILCRFRDAWMATLAARALARQQPGTDPCLIYLSQIAAMLAGLLDSRAFVWGKWGTPHSSKPVMDKCAYYPRSPKFRDRSGWNVCFPSAPGCHVNF